MAKYVSFEGYGFVKKNYGMNFTKEYIMMIENYILIKW